LLKFFFSFNYYFTNIFLFFFIFLISFSIFFSFVKAINEFNFFKLFAYSGIGNYCFAILPYFIIQNLSDFMPLFFYLYIYSLTLIGFFVLLSSGFLFSKYKETSITFSYTFFSHNRGFLLPFFFVCYMLSFGGLPFFFGFLAKAGLSYFLISKWVYWFYFFLSLLNTLSFFYILRLIRITFFDIIINSYFSLDDEN
jgi:NADH-quinone oxidoreductase subunit N